MLKRPANRTLGLAIAALGLLALAIYAYRQAITPMQPEPKLLSDLFLQLPTDNSVRVVWFTEFAGSRHTVSYGQNFDQTAAATTSKLSRIREDQNSRVGT